MWTRPFLVVVLLVGMPLSMTLGDEIELNKLPMAVKKGVQNRFPKAKLVSATKDVIKSETFYSVELKEGAQEIDVTLTAQGTIEDITKTIATGKLPEAVRQAVNVQYPGAKFETVREISSVTDGQEAVAEYEVVLKTKEKQEIEVTITPAGVIEAIVRVITADKLPEAVRKTLNKQYPFAKIEEIKEVSSLTDGKEAIVEYDVTLKTRGKGEIEVDLSPDGKVIEGD